MFKPHLHIRHTVSAGLMVNPNLFGLFQDIVTTDQNEIGSCYGEKTIEILKWKSMDIVRQFGFVFALVCFNTVSLRT